jgi:beta-ketoacyl-acyl-carrier-protein synthase II
MLDRVVVTGCGAITPLGLTVDETWKNMIDGVSGIGYISMFDTDNFQVKIAAEVKDFDSDNYMDPMTARYSDRFTQFAIAAGKQAAGDAQLSIHDSNTYDIGVIVGTGLGGIESLSRQVNVLARRGPSRVSSYTIPMTIPDSCTGRLSIEMGIRGVNLSLISACAAGTDAIGMAYRMIRHRELKMAIAGGTDASITPISVAGFQQAGALSRSQEPSNACRPFDAQRNGFIMGEGAAILVVESLESALERGVSIIAEIVGYGATSDAFHITKPRETNEVAAKAIELALAGVNRDEIGYISAHGTSTQINDISETRVIKKALGKQAYDIPVSSVKSMVGHMIGAAGALGTIVCCKVVNEGVLPPTINYEYPDPKCDLDYVPNIARKKDITVAVSNAFGFGGHNSVLAIRKYNGK